MAKAGSWRIGFSPIPSLGIGKIWLNGLEVFIIKIKKPIIIICWNSKVKILYCLVWSLDLNRKININNVNEINAKGQRNVKQLIKQLKKKKKTQRKRGSSIRKTSKNVS